LIITFFYIKIEYVFLSLAWVFLKEFFVYFYPHFPFQRTSHKKAFTERNPKISTIFFIIGVRVQRLVLFFVFFIFLINPLVAFASNYSAGLNAMNNGNNEEAVKFFRFAAEDGDAFSQHCLGLMLYKGQGVKQNYEEAIKWLSLAVKQGLSQAKLDLAVIKYHKKRNVNYIGKYN
jgi:hypothetical protein